ncbi:MAG: diadenylate cyclase CdaA [Kiritimatiellae bacterium]|nr:diadenylate cyclase CdaA [Kiritimatiellia bacterium]MDD3544566.1 diadenylate cyclase CdaA [Kiritimatiellia bacterium]MDD4025487.1 diadenylate cyclase CdaA [Kiritimatiellia bacterium]MDD4622351.1 diadenylate cyclase CdaA [Kiritimatiellia bacterium]
MFEGLQIGLNDLMQILVLYLGIYALLRFVRGTRSAQVLLGFCVLVVSLLLFTYLFRFDVLARVVYFLLVYLALSMVVVFQQDIRRVLALVGGQRLFGRHYAVRQEAVPEKLCRSLISLGKSRIGALIAVERGISLHGFEDTGVKLNALVSHELLVSIFTPPLPLHDGGIIMRDGTIASAHCLFPVSNQGDLATSGMRHRAAVGLSEETDAVVVVVSEETGKISVAHNGRLHRYSDVKVEKLLLRWLRKAMPNQTRGPVSLTDWLTFYMKKFFNGKQEAGHAV